MKAGHYLYYDTAGRIVGAAFCLPTDAARNAPPGTGWIASNHAPEPATEWVDDGALAARPAQDSTLTGLVLASLPDPCEVVIEGDRYPVTGGTVTLSFGLPGTYAVRVEAFPWLDADFEVTAP